MTREELKDYYLDQARNAETAEEAKTWTDCYAALEKNDIQAEKNASDYELAERKLEKEGEIEVYKADKEAETEEKSILQRIKDSKLKNWIFFGTGVAVAAVTEGIRAWSKHHIADKVIYAEKHDDMYINGNKYSDKQF